MIAWEKRKQATDRRKELRARALAYKGGKCRICGYDKCLTALEFHHVEILTKEFTISARMTSWDVIKPELDKCELLCANCHREVHDGMHVGYVTYEDRLAGHDFDDEPAPLPEEGVTLYKHCPQCYPTGDKASVLKSLCKRHFDALEPLSPEDIRASLEKGHRAREAYERENGHGLRIGGVQFYR